MQITNGGFSEKATACGESSQGNTATQRPADKSQSRTVLSSLPRRAQRASGVSATEVTLPMCPSSVARHWPVDRSQYRTMLREAAHCPLDIPVPFVVLQRTFTFSGDQSFV